MSRAIDLTGQVFGDLTVIERDKSKIGGAAYWICQCSCGNIKSIRGQRLKNNEVTNCGCKPKRVSKLDTTSQIGRKYGRLTVIERDLSYPTGHQCSSYWKCQCECGNIVTVRLSQLTSGKTRSCGCLKSDLLKDRNTLDLTGKRFGKLVAIRNTYELTPHHSYIWECLCDCGNIHFVSAEILQSGKIHSCGCISSSQGEEKIESILIDNNIPYIKEYTFSDLKSDKGRFLRYDFAILNEYSQVQRLIEYDGEQHFIERSKYYSERLIEADKIKNEYAKAHNIDLIRIPYTELNNISIQMIMGEKFLC